ncbi:hypothetical protein ACFOLA_07755 [Salinicoccus hispanicus]|uniref:Uncharacterized protein n=1 Tax=Salinicoccus hispanicus TaxID=157225 RepID=A0A6N8U7M1_9STAP|nr:hypothetical protein [Salinicoccus hispanicus]MXQ51649.1 hypothetical protein [Salinicoccus hispanicus]
MIHRKYLRATLVSLYSIAFFGLMMLVYYFATANLVDTLIYFFTISLSLFILAGTSFYFYRQTKDHDPGFRELDYSEIREVIMKFDVWYFKRLMIFDYDGKYIGRAAMKIDSPKAFIFSFLSHFNIIVPIDYILTDHEGKTVCRFRRGGFRSADVNIYDENNIHIGRIEFDELKILLKFKGTAFVDGQAFPISSEYLFEDARSNGIMSLSSFNSPIGHHYIFREMSNEVATFDSPIDTNLGKTALSLTALIYFLRYNK